MSPERAARVWVLARRPEGVLVPADFRLRELLLPALAEGQVQVRNLLVIGGPVHAWSHGCTPGQPSLIFR